jgi:hypothetical protein
LVLPLDRRAICVRDALDGNLVISIMSGVNARRKQRLPARRSVVQSSVVGRLILPLAGSDLRESGAAGPARISSVDTQNRQLIDTSKPAIN